MRKKILIICGVLAGLILIAFVIRQYGVMKNKLPDKYVRINNRVVSVEVADTLEEQQQGLSNRAPLTDKEGMLFVFPDKQVRNFWMKDMLFPLDIIWIADGRIVKISADLPPEGKNPQKIYGSGEPINYVLEVNAGWAARNGVITGDSVVIKLADENILR